MDIVRMKEFIVFAKYLNVTKASQELLMTQSNLSKHIKRMEIELGFELIIKNGTKLVLTHEGERFLSTCNEIVSIYEKSIAECLSSKAERRGGLTVQEPSYSDSTAEAFYMLIERFRSSVQDSSIKYFRPYRKNLLEELLEEKMDIIITYKSRDAEICIQEYADKGLVAIPLAKDCLTVWCPSGHRFAEKKHISLSDLSSASIMAPNDVYTPIRDIIANYGIVHGTELTFDIVESDRSSTLLSMRRQDSVYVLPNSVKNDIRIKVRNDMVFCPLEEDRLCFTSFAILRASTLDIYPELKTIAT